MSTSLKISANTSEAKKSLLDLGREVKSLGKSKVSVFSETDRKFIKNELNRELGLMKTKLSENKNEISKLIREQTKLERGTKAELDARKKIIEAFKTQSRLAQQMERTQRQSKDLGGFGGMGGSSGGSGGVMGMLGKLGSLIGGASLAIGGLALVRGYQASQQFAGGAKNRVRLRGLGMESMNVGSPEELARAGLTEQEFIKRQTQAVSRLGRAGGSRESIMQQAKFERSFGLEGGTFTNIAGSLRGGFGGKGAEQTQMKLQASILASGIEDAIGPYLDSVTDLLSDINKNGVTNTDEIINVMSQFVKDGNRTPEQIANAFKTLDTAVRSSTGEANAFLQSAFARGGIGGGAVGATRLALSSGGMFGLNADELQKRGYNPELLKNMQGAGFMSGVGDRSSAITQQFKTVGGMRRGQKFSDVKDVNQMTGLSMMANSVLGTQGEQGFDALLMLEKVQNKQMSQKQFEAKVQEMRDKKDPQVDRLNKINASLEGQTEILRNINTNLMESLGKTAVKAGNIAVEADNMLVEGTKTGAEAINSTGALDAGMKGMQSTRKGLTGGGIGSWLYEKIYGTPEEENARILKDTETKFGKKGNMPSDQTASEQAASQDQGTDSMAKAVETGMTRAMQAQQKQVIQNNNKVNIRIQNSDGQIKDKTHK